MNDIKQISKSEKKNIKNIRKSIYLNTDKLKNDIICERNLITLRPFNGIYPTSWKNVVDKRLLRNKKIGEPLK